MPKDTLEFAESIVTQKQMDSAQHGFRAAQRSPVGESARVEITSVDASDAPGTSI